MFAVDTNVILDVLAGPDETARRSATLLETQSGRGALVACGFVWAELAARREAADVDRALTALRIRVDWNLGREAVQAAVEAWRRYLAQRQSWEPSFICPNCNHEAGEWRCPHCGGAVPPPRHLLTDFIIGGHAEGNGLSLITRDRGIYQRYFPNLGLIQP